MQVHFNNWHPGVDTAKHEDLWKLTPEELEAVAEVWKACHKQPKQRRKGKLRVPLKVSEAHSSRKLLRYIMYLFMFKMLLIMLQLLVTLHVKMR